ncbi:hypothetical protein CK203_016648 [Vitis vinifera]|uniref:Uncharacterized protein n=1 Tax=Vitis vinifera TaxID=29760 RepID=A0A438J2P0_VITVI|nr:hypothetical protein CK203_016648 [Vitis vinifera]
MPEATLPASPITQNAPPVVPATSAPPPSSEPTVTVSLMEFRGLVLSLQTLSTTGPQAPLRILFSSRWPLFVHTMIRSLLLRPSIPRSFIRSSSI